MAQQKAAYAIFNGLWPLHGDSEHGPSAVRLPIDFTTVANQTFDLTEEEMLTQLKYVQTLYIDNGANVNALTCVVQISQQRIIVKGNTQGYYPVLVPNLSQFTFSLAAIGAVIVPVYFINVAMPAFQWPTV